MYVENLNTININIFIWEQTNPEDEHISIILYLHMFPYLVHLCTWILEAIFKFKLMPRNR